MIAVRCCALDFVVAHVQDGQQADCAPEAGINVASATNLLEQSVGHPRDAVDLGKSGSSRSGT